VRGEIEEIVRFSLRKHCFKKGGEIPGQAGRVGKKQIYSIPTLHLAFHGSRAVVT